jgi:hypothetical protein
MQCLKGGMPDYIDHGAGQDRTGHGYAHNLTYIAHHGKKTSGYSLKISGNGRAFI